MKKILNYFSRGEIIIWIAEVILIVTFFCIFDRKDFLNLISSLIGITALIFCAKGNPIGQALVIVFSALYGIISFGFAYYGEMITYLGMTAPMALISLISWARHPNGENRSEVKIRSLNKLDVIIMIPATIAVTVIFYFILRAFGTANLLTSTVSVTTSFAAAYLAFKRSPYYAVAYILNDIILIVLWSMAAAENISYISVIACFAAFLINDVYTFINWKKMQKKQKQ
jgi:nicotinamide mononucleotide transporter PnuC